MHFFTYSLFLGEKYSKQNQVLENLIAIANAPILNMAKNSLHNFELGTYLIKKRYVFFSNWHEFLDKVRPF